MTTTARCLPTHVPFAGVLPVALVLCLVWSAAAQAQTVLEG